MLIFILNSIIILFSIFLIIFDYFYIKNKDKELESRIKRFIFGGIEILVIGIILVSFSIIGSKSLDINMESFLLIVLILVSIIVYISLILVWNKMFKKIQQHISKKIYNDFKFKFKSISIYGLVYSFGVLFYLVYTFVFFR